MSSFTNALIIVKLNKKDLFEVYEPFDYHVGTEDSDIIIKVPKGFVTDLASIPWFARWLISKVGRSAQAGVLHDWCYFKQLFPRKQCDDIFIEAMEVLGVPKWKRVAMHRSVRLFGFISWGRKDKFNRSDPSD